MPPGAPPMMDIRNREESHSRKANSLSRTATLLVSRYNS
jgi:hypothetical protein